MKTERTSPRESLRVELLDANGNPKPIFQENRFFLWLIRNGLSPHTPKIPGLLGRWNTYKEIEYHGNH